MHYDTYRLPPLVTFTLLPTTTEQPPLALDSTLDSVCLKAHCTELSHCSLRELTRFHFPSWFRIYCLHPRNLFKALKHFLLKRHIFFFFLEICHSKGLSDASSASSHVECVGGHRYVQRPMSLTLSSLMEESKPAPKTLSCPSCLHRPNSTVKK